VRSPEKSIAGRCITADTACTTRQTTRALFARLSVLHVVSFEIHIRTTLYQKRYTVDSAPYACITPNSLHLAVHCILAYSHNIWFTCKSKYVKMSHCCQQLSNIHRVPMYTRLMF